MPLDDSPDCNLHLGVVNVGEVPSKQIVNAVTGIVCFYVRASDWA